MKNFTYCQPTKIIFGRNTIAQLIEEMTPLTSKILLHYGGKSATKSGLLDQVKQALNASNIQYIELGGVVPNPRLSLVQQGIDIVRKEDITAILALGGGSVIDSAKAISIGVPYDGQVWDFFASKAKIQQALPIFTILTIPAAGSEASNSCVITNESGPIKKGVNSDLMRPLASLLDPSYTFTLPVYQSAAGGVDIMAHVMERYFTNEKNVDLTDRLCEATLKTIIHNLPLALANPSDYNPRAEIMWASTLAHNDLLSTGRIGDWASHAIAHQASALYDMTHGAALSIIFPAWMSYVYKHDVARFAQFATRVWGVEANFDDLDSTALEGITRMKSFFASVGMPISLNQANIPYSRLEEMAARATANDTIKIGNFVPLAQKDIYEIYHLAL